MAATAQMGATSLRRQMSLLIEWSPVIGLITALGDAKPGVPRVIAFLNLMRFVASKTPIRQDDELLSRLEAIVLTEQGRALIDYVGDEIATVLSAYEPKPNA